MQYNPEQISIVVKHNKHEVNFKLKYDTKISKVMQTFSDRQGQNYTFQFRGTILRGDETPDSLNMSEGCYIIASDPTPKIRTSRSYMSDKRFRYEDAITLNIGSVIVKVRPDTELVKAKRAFCNRQGISQNNTIFFYNETKVEDFHTPEMLGIKDKDSLVYFVSEW